MKPLPVPLPKQHLSPPVALALFEQLQELTDALWREYENELVELIMSERNHVPPSQQSLDFGDELPF